MALTIERQPKKTCSNSYQFADNEAYKFSGNEACREYKIFTHFRTIQSAGNVIHGRKKISVYM